MINVKRINKTYYKYFQSNSFWTTLKGIFKREYEPVYAVKNLSFSVKEGEIVGLLGPNGSGKSTIMKILCGILPPDNGELSVLNFLPFAKNISFLKQIAFIAGQKHQLWWDLPPVDSFYLMREIYEVDKKKFEENLSFLVQTFNVSNLLNVQSRKLSLGERMKMEIICSLLHMPKVIFLDEPSLGLDILAQEQIYHIIKTYNKKYNSTILLTSHYLEDVKSLCNKIIIIKSGEKIYDGTLKDLKSLYTQNVKITVQADILSNALFSDFPKLKKESNNIFTINCEKNKLPNFIEKLDNIESVQNLLIEEPSIEETIKKLFEK